MSGYSIALERWLPIEIFLAYHYYAFLCGITLLVFLALIINLYTLSKSLSGITWKSWLILFFIVTMNFLVWKFYTPHIPHVYYDQFIHMDIAHNLAQNHMNVSTLQGSRDFIELPNKPSHYPPGYHYLLSNVFTMFGSTENTAFNFSFILGFLSIIFYFFLIYFIIEDQEVALWSAFMLSIAPVFLKYSATYSLEICSLLFLVLTILSIALYYKKRHWYLFLTSVIVCCFTCYLRVENFLLIVSSVIIFTVSLLFFQRSARQSINTWHYYLLLLAIPLLYPLFLQIYYSFKYLSPAGWSPEIGEYAHRFIRFLGINISFFFKEHHPFLFTLLAIAGFCIIIKKRKDFYYFNAFLMIWGIICLFVYSCYIDFVFHADSERHTLIIYITLCFLSGLCLSLLLKRYSGEFKNILILMVTVILCVSSKSPFDNLISKSDTRVVYHEYEFIKTLEKKNLDLNTYIVCSCNVSEVAFLLNHKTMSINQFVSWMDNMDSVYYLQDSQWLINSNKNLNIDDLYYKIDNIFYNELIECKQIGKYDFRLYKLTRKKINYLYENSQGTYIHSYCQSCPNSNSAD